MFTARKTLEWPDQSKDKEQTKHGVIHGKSTPTDLLNQLETWLMRSRTCQVQRHRNAPATLGYLGFPIRVSGSGSQLWTRDAQISNRQQLTAAVGHAHVVCDLYFSRDFAISSFQPQFQNDVSLSILHELT